jgi:hypothetical protein
LEVGALLQNEPNKLVRLLGSFVIDSTISVVLKTNPFHI